MTIKQFISVITIIPHLILCSDIEIKPIQLHHIEPAREIITQAAFELQIEPSDSLEQLRKDIKNYGWLDDLNNIDTVYTHKKGIFLVMTHNDIVIGMAAIKYFDEEICELKRMFFDPKYRGKGLGTKMLKTLLEYAQEFGYKKIRLEVFNPYQQIKAINLYKRFDFYEIPSYQKSPNNNLSNQILSMEKIL